MELKGLLHVKNDTEVKSDTFKVREFVIEVANEKNSEWNDFVRFQLMQDKCAKIDNVHLGDEVTVTFNIRGRKSEKDGKVSYFNSLDAWKIDINKVGATTQPPAECPTHDDDGSDHLPF
jgi:excinuclease UvrABC helicase subunit UvrB